MGDFLYLYNMEKGYVYIARIIDHGGKFVNGYHKIGKSLNNIELERHNLTRPTCHLIYL